MDWQLPPLAAKVWPGLEKKSVRDQMGALYELLGALYAAPLALAGLAWLIARTEPGVLYRNWPALLLLCALLFLFKALDFFFFIETEGGDFAQFVNSFEGVVVWSAALVYGPSALWLAVLGDAVHWGRAWRRAATIRAHWDSVRNGLSNLAISTLTRLLALAFYQRLGGAYPLPGLALDAVWPAFVATFAHAALSLLVYVPLLVYVVRVRRVLPALAVHVPWPRAIATGLATVTGSTFLIQMWAILAAGLHTLNGATVYFTLIAGLLFLSGLANRLSRAFERSQQRSRELARLEALGRAMLAAPPDASALPDVLREHVPGMFSRSRMEIRMGDCPLYAGQTILRLPENPADPGTSAPASTGGAVSKWEWLCDHPEPRHFSPKAELPWGGVLPAHLGAVLVPILDVESGTPLGGVYLSRVWDTRAMARLLPAVQSLAALVASALHRARVYESEQRAAAEKAQRQRDMEQAIAAERSRLARDLHDSVTQSLYSLTLLAEAGQRMISRLGAVEPTQAAAPNLSALQGNQTRLGDISQQALQEMRLLVYQLRPLALESEGLVGALEQRLETVERRAGVQARVSVKGPIELEPDVEEELYRIAQEALNNALKHARASRVELAIRGDEGAVTLQVIDDGRGFDPKALGDSGGLGLVSMRERAARIGARLDVWSAPGEGTTVTVHC